MPTTTTPEAQETLRRLADELDQLDVIAITPVRNVTEAQSKLWIDHPMGAGFTGNRSRAADWLRAEATR